MLPLTEISDMKDNESLKTWGLLLAGVIIGIIGMKYYSPTSFNGKTAQQWYSVYSSVNNQLDNMKNQSSATNQDLEGLKNGFLKANNDLVSCIKNARTYTDYYGYNGYVVKDKSDIDFCITDNSAAISSIYDQYNTNY